LLLLVLRHNDVLCCAVLCCALQGEFPLDLVPVDDDVLSLELDTAFK
jgi:hypothetical protein